MRFLKQLFSGWGKDFRNDAILFICCSAVGILFLILGTFVWAPLFILGVIILLIGAFLGGFWI